MNRLDQHDQADLVRWVRALMAEAMPLLPDTLTDSDVIEAALLAYRDQLTKRTRKPKP